MYLQATLLTRIRSDMFIIVDDKVRPLGKWDSVYHASYVRYYQDKVGVFILSHEYNKKRKRTWKEVCVNDCIGIECKYKLMYL